MLLGGRRGEGGGRREEGEGGGEREKGEGGGRREEEGGRRRREEGEGRRCRYVGKCMYIRTHRHTHTLTKLTRLTNLPTAAGIPSKVRRLSNPERL